MEILTFLLLITFRWPVLYDPIFDAKNIPTLLNIKEKKSVYQLLITMLSQNTENRKVAAQLHTEGL